MASIKVKFRPSSVAGKMGSIYYQLIHERIPRQIPTEYHVFPSEWNKARSTVMTEYNSDRKFLILSIRERIRFDVERISKVIRRLEDTGITYTTDDIVSEFRSYVQEYSLFNFMQGIIFKLKQNGKLRTSETYTATLNSFKKFREGHDLMLECLSSDIMESFEAWHKSQGNCINTISFYIRILRAVYNRAVEEEIIENRFPFRHVYTGIDKTVKRALPLNMVKKIRLLDLSLNPALDYARDIFLMSFMLRGMSFIDMAFLRKQDLTNGYVTYRRRKTGQQLAIAWTKDMQAILD
ncbi:MAG: site-specific integrase, partial [Muribaculaceae bacterium]|nr:site-specific integrase [Muribaculaceae bacterium]